MSRNPIVVNSVLWAAAILAAAILAAAWLDAPIFLTLVVLPSLATLSWLAAVPSSTGKSCGAQGHVD